MYNEFEKPLAYLCESLDESDRKDYYCTVLH